MATRKIERKEARRGCFRHVLPGINLENVSKIRQQQSTQDSSSFNDHLHMQLPAHGYLSPVTVIV